MRKIVNQMMKKVEKGDINGIVLCDPHKKD